MIRKGLLAGLVLALVFAVVLSLIPDSSDEGTGAVHLTDIKDQPGRWICLHNADDQIELRFAGSSKPALEVGYQEDGMCRRLDPYRASVVSVSNSFLGVSWGISVYADGTLVWQDVQGVSGEHGALDNQWLGRGIVHRQIFDKTGRPIKAWTVNPS